MQNAVAYPVTEIALVSGRGENTRREKTLDDCTGRSLRVSLATVEEAPRTCAQGADSAVVGLFVMRLF